MIYLDYAATAPTEPEALKAMLACAEQAWANPSAPYSAAGAARRTMRLAREAVAKLLNAQPQEIVFTSGGSEANAQALFLAEGGHAVVSSIEHASVLNAARRWARAVTTVAPGPDGRVSPEAVIQAIRPDTRLISVMLANNETGVIQPAAAIGAAARARRIPFHCDAVQGFGQIPVDVTAMNIDLLSLSGHKLGGPRGAGALYVRQGVAIRPLIEGGGQEFGLRSGTEDVPAICGLGEAVRLAAGDMAKRAARERALLADFASRIRRSAAGCRILCEESPRLPGLLALCLPGLEAVQAVARLDLLGIAVSGGAACAARSQSLSRAYLAAGLSQDQARQVVRVSIGRHTTAQELETAADAIVRMYNERC